MSKISALVILLVLAIIGTALAPLHASAVLSRYRDVALGDSVSAVVEQLRGAQSDVKVLYEQPSLVQELTWRPQRFVSGAAATPDPLGELVLTFHQGRLARMVATYERDKTQGLTDEDLLELLSKVYGLSILESTPLSGPLGRAFPRRAIAGWADLDTLVVLWREEYPGRIGLTITSTAADVALQETIVEGKRLETEDAPKRELARQAAAAAAIKSRDAQIRLDNKAKFRP